MWTKRIPQYGDHIRVNRGLYYHHGIYVDNNCVIQFASLIPGRETDPDSASICDTTLENFLKGGELEVRDYNNEELKTKRSPEEIVEYAKSCYGRKGYDIINNNCEHFANECVFGERKSNQVEDILGLLGALFGGTR